ncbi:MAG: type II toxin-antitoxin system HicB family antitoxin [Nitrososphaera sp.]|jgi:predicted RNase H-like HicB family nuclease
MSVKLRDVKTRIIKEDDGSYSITCSALGVYSVGKNLDQAKKNFHKALKLYLEILREKAIEPVVI